MDDVLRKAPLFRHEHRHVPGLDGQGHGGVPVVALLGDNALNGLGGDVGRAEPAVLHPQKGHRADGHHSQGQVGHGGVHGPADPAVTLAGGKARLSPLGEKFLPHGEKGVLAGGQGLQVCLGLGRGDAGLFQGGFIKPLAPGGRGTHQPGGFLPGEAQSLPAEQGRPQGEPQLHDLPQGICQGEGQGEPGAFRQRRVLFLFQALGAAQGGVQAV